MKADRRQLLALGAAAACAGAGGAAALAFHGDPMPEGELAGADFARGHRLRQGNWPEPTRFDKVPLLIAGGGVAGLAAAWRLRAAGFDDFRLVELEDRFGGNARSGRNHVSAFPLGAHYLPVPNREAGALRRMITEFGMIVGERDGAPVFDPEQLCADLQERLFWQGRWQEGLIPRQGLTSSDRADLAAFQSVMAHFSSRVGSDGRPAFALPIAYSSRDADLVSLDALSFAKWLDQQGWHSPVLRAHVRYAMRDDYGTEPDQVSAWAGVHYFASRRGWAADGAGDNELTWPEGNGRLVAHMARRAGDRLIPGQIVHRVARDGDTLLVDQFDCASGTTIRTQAKATILAMPHFVASRVCPEVGGSDGFSYAPWLVANVTVDRLPQGRGVPLAWDNVSSTSNSLGYVVATHQGPDAIASASVLTWYLPLSDMRPELGRRLLLERPADAWRKMVRDDLLASNPELEGAIRRIDLWRWGHAMIRPTPGFLARGASVKPEPPVFVAHSDLSGLSLFEEAHYHGVRAAEEALAHLGHFTESLL